MWRMYLRRSVDTIEKSKAFVTQKNLATQDVVSLNVSYPFMHKNYMWITNLNNSYSKYEANFGGGNRNVNLDVFLIQFLCSIA